LIAQGPLFQGLRPWLLPVAASASAIARWQTTGYRRLFCQDPRTFYFACPTVSDDGFPRQQSSGPADSTLCGVLQRARGAGCSYLLLAEPLASASRTGPSGREVPEGPLSLAAENDSPQIGQVMPILEYRFADDNNRSIRYRLLRIR
jgi:hypothetical protein